MNTRDELETIYPWTSPFGVASPEIEQDVRFLIRLGLRWLTRNEERLSQISAKEMLDEVYSFFEACVLLGKLLPKRIYQATFEHSLWAHRHGWDVYQASIRSGYWGPLGGKLADAS